MTSAERITENHFCQPQHFMSNNPSDTLLSLSQSSEVSRIRFDPAQVNSTETDLVLVMVAETLVLFKNKKAFEKDTSNILKGHTNILQRTHKYTLPCIHPCTAKSGL